LPTHPTVPLGTCSALALLCSFPLLAASAAGTAPQLGSGNTVTADPPVSRPPGVPCVVQLFSGFTFANYSPKPFAYAPPTGCAGPWAKVVFNGDFAVTAGRQYDRTAHVWIGGTNVYFGTTAEPSRIPPIPRSWHVERDLTDYSALLRAPQPGLVVLGNLVDNRYTGVLSGTAWLEFYPPTAAGERDDGGLAGGPGQDDGRAPRVPDLVLPLSAGPNGDTVSLGTTAAALTRTFSLPRNVERAYLDVIAQSQYIDEFWYTCVPDDLAVALQSCGATAFRETQIAIDGQPAGVAPIFPWIYTGGIDPYLWRPIPSVQALNFVPYRVDLTPFAALLSDGKPHAVSLNVFNANNYFSVTATLLVYLDAGSAQVTGALTRNTLAAGPSPQIAKAITASPDLSYVKGTVGTTAQRTFTVDGYVLTSHGKVRTEIVQRIDFSNQQFFDITPAVYVQNIVQATDISSTTTTHGSGPMRVSKTQLSWPLTIDYSQDASSFTTNLRAASLSTDALLRGADLVWSRTVSNSVAPTDTYVFGAPPRGQASSQRYFSKDSAGHCYSRAIAAAGGVLTSLVDGQGCPATE
jgi:hypothetical protein